MVMKNFIKTAIFFLILAVLAGCNARKSHTKIDEKKVDSSVVAKKETTASAKIVEKTYEISDLSQNSLNFSIIPNEKDTIVVTKFIKIKDKNGNIVEVPYKSNSRFEYNSKNSQNKQVKEYSKQIDSLVKINALKVAKLKSYKKQKEKQTEKKTTRFPIIIPIVLAIGLLNYAMLKRHKIL